ncbi:MAG: hypothetical protein H0U23_13980 [Blastocatellia bacterium]|nr:hypothetical protein [Blastocatellia bacterium]
MLEGQKKWRQQQAQLGLLPNMEGISRWRKQNPEAYANNQKSAAGAMKNWQLAHPEEVKEHNQKLVERAKLWREANPEIWATNLALFVQTPRHRKDGGIHSKAERWLKKNLLTWPSAQISCENTRKQVDFVSPDHKVMIEVDGGYHFFPIAKGRKKTAEERLAYAQERDKILNDEVTRRGDVCLIRLSARCFRTSDGRMKKDWLDWLTQMLLSSQPGVWCCGELYESVPWASEGCTILRSPIQSTTSSSQAA